MNTPVNTPVSASIFAPMFAIWRQPLAERRAVGNLGLTWCLLVLSLLGTLSLALPIPQRWPLFAFLTGVPMGMLLIMWWAYLCANVATQCHPAALRLVPGLGAEAQRALFVAWLAIVAVMTLLAGVPTGHAGLVAVVTALVLIEAGVMGTVTRYAIIGAAGWALSHAGHDTTEWLRGFIGTPVAMVAGAVLVLADGAVALHRVASGKNPVRTRRNAVAALQENNGPGGRSVGWPQWDLDPQTAFLQPLGRSWLGLHLFSIGIVALVCAGLRFLAAWQGHADLHAFFAGHRSVLAIAMCGVLAMIVYQESQRFTGARIEQALLCLTPAAPERRAMNRLLARSLLAGFGRCWLILGVSMMAALGVLGAQVPELARLSAVWVVALLLGAYALRDFAHAGNPPGWPGALLLAVLGGAGVAAVSGHGAPGVWIVTAAVGAVLVLSVARWRWQAMLSAAPALPAGRFAK